MLDLAVGTDGPDSPPPASYYDMSIDYVRYYYEALRARHRR